MPVLQLHAEDDRYFVTQLFSFFRFSPLESLLMMMLMIRVIPLDLAMNLHKVAVDGGKTNIKLQV